MSNSHQSNLTLIREAVIRYFKSSAVFVETGGKVPLWFWHLTLYSAWVVVLSYLGSEIYYSFIANVLV
jgi:hypothetical protein